MNKILNKILVSDRYYDIFHVFCNKFSPFIVYELLVHQTHGNDGEGLFSLSLMVDGGGKSKPFAKSQRFLVVDTISKSKHIKVQDFAIELDNHCRFVTLI
jgi:hypothetical protein